MDAGENPLLSRLGRGFNLPYDSPGDDAHGWNLYPGRKDGKNPGTGE